MGKTIAGSNGDSVSYMTQAQVNDVISEAVRYIPSKDMREYLLENLPSWDWRQCFSVAFKYAGSKHEKIRYFRFMLCSDFVPDDRCRYVIKKAMKIMRKCPSERVESRFVQTYLKDPEFPSIEKRRAMSYEEVSKLRARHPWFWDSWLGLPEIFRKGEVVRCIVTGDMYVISRNSDSDLLGQDSSDDMIVGNILKTDYAVSDDEKRQLAKSYGLEPDECDLKVRMEYGYYHYHLDPCMLEKVADADIPEKYRTSLAKAREALS